MRRAEFSPVHLIACGGRKELLIETVFKQLVLELYIPGNNGFRSNRHGADVLNISSCERSCCHVAR